MKKLLFILLFISSSIFAQQNVQVDLSNPKATLYTHIYFLQPDSYNEVKSASTIPDLPREDAIDKAIKIKKVLDGKGLILDFGKIPSDPNYLDTISKFQLNM